MVDGADQEEQVVRLLPTSVDLPAVVVSATRRAQTFAESPVSISVTDRRAAMARNSLTLISSLYDTPGVSRVGSHVSVRGSSGYSRGTGSRVLLLMDGTPIVSADNADIKWDVIPPTEVERIEVVKGAGSALYGTGALGGVINVITRQPSARPTTEYRLIGGLYSQPVHSQWRWTDDRMYMSGVDVRHSRTIGSTGLSVAAGTKRGTGYEENDDFVRHNLFGKAVHRVGDRTTITGLASWAVDDHGVFIRWKSRTHPLEVPDADESAATVSRKLALHSLVHHTWSARLGSQLRTFYFHTDVDNSRAAGGFNTAGHKLGVETQVDYSGWGRGRLALGGSTIYDMVFSPADFAGRRSVANLALFGQAVYELAPWAELAVGLRYDVDGRDLEGDEDADGLCAARPGRVGHRWEHQVSPQVGLACHPRPTTDLRASVGRGFRAPSVTEAHAQAIASGILLCPNPTLGSEKSWSGEIGARQTLGGAMSLDVALFWNEYEGLVEARPDPNPLGATPTASFHNISEARVRGVEIEHRLALPRGFRWRASYTFLDAVEFLKDGEILAPYCREGLIPGGAAPLPYRARHAATLALGGPLGPLSAGIDFRYASQFERISGLFPECGRDHLPVYVVDVSASRRLGPTQIRLRIDNLLQYHYVLAEREIRPLRRLSLSLAGAL